MDKIEGSTLKPMFEVLGGEFARIHEATFETENEALSVESMSWGIPELDALTGGIPLEQLVLVAGRPSMAKTSLAIKAIHAVMNAGLPVAAFTPCASARQFARRVTSSMCRVETRRLATGRMTEDEWASVCTVLGENSRIQNLYVSDAPSLTAEAMSEESELLLRQVGRIGLIVLDYVQLLQGDQSSESLYGQQAKIMRDLKRLSRQTGATVLAISTATRACESRPNKRLVVGDIRDAGGAEDEADLILLNYRDELYNPDSTDKGVLEVFCAHNRFGPSRPTTRVLFDEASGAIDSLQMTADS